MNQVQTMAKLLELRLANTPAYDIVTRPGHELWTNGANPAQVAEDLCRNVHWYGRNGASVWQWGPGSGGNPSGEALARGQVVNTNCGGFNTTARWIGHNVMGLPTAQFKGSYTNANDYFVTQANTLAIDRNWAGNVRTLTQDFAAVQAFFFMGHSFCRYGANMLDASTNVMNFHQKTDLYWCTLDRRFSDPVKGRAFRVSLVHAGGPPIHGTAPYAVVSQKCLKAFQHLFPVIWQWGPGPGVTQSFINAMPATTGQNWETMLLVSIAHLPGPFTAAVNL